LQRTFERTTRALIAGKVRTSDMMLSDKCPALIESLEASTEDILHVPEDVLTIFHGQIVSAPDKSPFVCVDFAVELAWMAVQ
jgi:hypothetical protein